MTADKDPEPVMRPVAVIALTVLAALFVPWFSGAADRAGGALPVPAEEANLPRISRVTPPRLSGRTALPPPALVPQELRPVVLGRIAEGAMFRF
ncbi:hypothetical protein SAMN05444007_105122 [Cribrihabitans marinus]|uniref:Uncharacterized protein n=1 Tax=Cribrihabitans marinus TaxID=1227549 RepID=A0A1H6ZHC7_9RHOB|nr:hypothetical protein [Cribrihabitans marinus]GGH30767.1 hypothetical protein GCM10010973_21140 [Cribrihabitans marinus]SEJ52116.1 hypothetical protein SAMN05444007_105122 [Cribrihabitans marinus]